MRSSSPRLGRFWAYFQLITRPYVRRHPARILVLILSVALGVAAVVASGNLIETSVSSLEATWGAGSSLADLRVSNGFAGVPEHLTEVVATTEGVEHSSGHLSAQARIDTPLGTADLHIVAVDLFGDDPIHRVGLGLDRAAVEDAALLVARPESVLLDHRFASAHGLEAGGFFEAEVRGLRMKLYLAALLEPTPASTIFAGALGVMDLPAAQLLFERRGMLESIAVSVAEGHDTETVRQVLSERVEGRATVTRAGGQSAELRSILSSIRLILGIPGWIAIVVGALVVYHAVAIAVSQRKPQLDVIRAVGGSRRSLLSLLAAEGLAVGLLGAVIGVSFGIFLSRAAARFVEQSVSTIYRPLTVASPEISWTFVAVGTLLGVSITTFSFLQPARSALRMGGGLSVASPRLERWNLARRRASLGAILVPFGMVFSCVEQAGVRGEQLAAAVSFGDALILLGLGLFLPVAVLALATPVSRGIRASRLVLLRIAWQNFTSDSARSATVVTAVMIGSAYVIITVGSVWSLREGILDWLEDSQRADLVVTGPGSLGLLPSGPPLRSEIGGFIEAHPAVEQIEAIRLIPQPYGHRWVVLASRNPDAIGSLYPVDLVAGDLETARQSMRDGRGGIVSRHLAVQHFHRVGDEMEIRSPTGSVSYRIEAIVEDLYSADLGTVFVAPETLEERWLDRDVTSFHVWLGEGTDPQQARETLLAQLRSECSCAVLTLAEFQARNGEVADGLFLAAYALEVVASVLLAVAVLSFFAIAIVERRCSTETMRALGATDSQVRRSFVWEAAIIGLLGGALGCAIGTLLAVRMVKTTMRVSGGFTLDFILPPGAVVATVLASVLLCVFCVLVLTWSIGDRLPRLAGFSE